MTLTLTTLCRKHGAGSSRAHPPSSRRTSQVSCRRGVGGRTLLNPATGGVHAQCEQQLPEKVYVNSVDSSCLAA